MKVVLTISGDQILIHDPDTDYKASTLTDWINQARRALVGDNEVEVLTDTELAADDEPEGDDDAEDRIGFRGRRR